MRTDVKLPLWMDSAAARKLKFLSIHPTLIELPALGLTLHGEVLSLRMNGARVTTDFPFLIWNNTEVQLSFRWHDTCYVLSGTAGASYPDNSFSVEFDSVSRQRLDPGGGELDEELPVPQAAPEPSRAELIEHEQELKDAARHVDSQGPLRGIELRHHPRYELSNMHASLRCKEIVEAYDCRVLEISQGGCRIYSEEVAELEPGSEVELVFTFADFDLSLNAQVRMKNGDYQWGLMFERLSVRMALRLSRVIQALGQRQ